ncbi:hypothetical protein BWL13_00168 [Microbacterium oleivorans]|uniref:Uncharacterized protein n=1 Tax=Microbacterium oleivorans TaxID=273677 RepID=A0A031FTA1_9MICO|nr:hypothetical protein BWL13_00168 [Microbacterium oleivorans]EZP27527.1 hypothetical protein BW34_01515 [Microbacterium oleivorans]
MPRRSARAEVAATSGATAATNGEPGRVWREGSRGVYG